MRTPFLFLALCFGFYSSLSSAIEATQPFSETCPYLQCSEPMKRIENQFKLNQDVELSLGENVYSGECYHLSSSYDSRTLHYGLIFLSANGEHLRMNGLFGFFYPENPWIHWTPKDARKKFENSPSGELEHFGLHSAVNFAKNYPDVVWQYWLSQNPVTKELAVIGIWGSGHRLFCSLQLNSDSKIIPGSSLKTGF